MHRHNTNMKPANLPEYRKQDQNEVRCLTVYMKLTITQVNGKTWQT